MTADSFPLLASVDAVHGLKVFVVSMLLALTIGRLRAHTPAMRRLPRRK
jgi:hypothetical protein